MGVREGWRRKEEFVEEGGISIQGDGTEMKMRKKIKKTKKGIRL